MLGNIKVSLVKYTQYVYKLFTDKTGELTNVAISCK